MLRMAFVALILSMASPAWVRAEETAKFVPVITIKSCSLIDNSCDRQEEVLPVVKLSLSPVAEFLVAEWSTDRHFPIPIYFNVFIVRVDNAEKNAEFAMLASAGTEEMTFKNAYAEVAFSRKTIPEVLMVQSPEVRLGDHAYFIGLEVRDFNSSDPKRP